MWLASKDVVSIGAGQESESLAGMGDGRPATQVGE